VKRNVFDPRGVIPAALTVFHGDYSVDLKGTRSHFRYLAGVRGVSAVTINGHAGEVSACTFDEQRRILDAAADEIGDRIPLVCGIHGDGSRLAADTARMAAKSGASALLVFPTSGAAMGGRLTPEMVRLHYSAIADATDLPIIYFQYPLPSGQGLAFDDILALLDAVPSIRAIKDWCNDPVMHERLTRTIQARNPPVHMLSTHSAWLMSSLVMGAHGLLSGAGSVIAAQQVELFEAVQAGDLRRAQAVNDRIYPIVSAFYADPFVNMHNRMKQCLTMLGRIPRGVVRPPLAPIGATEMRRLRLALRESGMSE
jgi:4-hydroxy-tetrahydrodipicolinate synthase